MAGNNIKNQYLDNVKRHIRWKKAKDIAVVEISDHIDDLYDSYKEKGDSDDEAMNKAIRRIGDPELVGIQLNKVYKPVINFELIIMLLAFTIFGGFLYGFYTGYLNVIAVVIGVIAAICLYWMDYHAVMQKTPLLYATAIVLGLAAFIFDMFFAPVRMSGTSRWCYVVMLSPFIHAGLVYYLKSKKCRFEACIFWVTFIIPLILLALSNNASFIIAILILDISEIVFLIRTESDYFRKICKNRVMTICVLASLLFIAVFLIKCIVSNISINIEERSYIWKTWNSMNFVGTTAGTEFLQNIDLTKDVFPLLFLSLRYGWISVCIMGIVYILFTTIIVRIIRKLKSGLGMLISFLVMTMIGIQFVIAILCNFGVIGTSLYISFPFFGGGIMTFVNYILAGVLLSVSRYQNVIVE